MNIQKGIKTSELWVVVAFFGKAIGLDQYVTTDTVNQTVEVAKQLQELPYTDSAWPYAMAIVYIAGRSVIKIFEVKYLGK